MVLPRFVRGCCCNSRACSGHNFGGRVTIFITVNSFGEDHRFGRSTAKGCAIKAMRLLEYRISFISSVKLAIVKNQEKLPVWLGHIGPFEWGQRGKIEGKNGRIIGILKVTGNLGNRCSFK